MKMRRAFAAHASLDLTAADSISRAQLEQSESSSHTLLFIRNICYKTSEDEQRSRTFNFIIGEAQRTKQTVATTRMNYQSI